MIDPSRKYIGLAAWLLLLVMGCGSARRGEPIVGPLPLVSSQVRAGQVLFMKHCQQCHPGGEAGLGPALTNKPLPAFLVRMQVRQGFGAMPAFSEQEISAEQLDDLLGYLKELKSGG